MTDQYSDIGKTDVRRSGLTDGYIYNLSCLLLSFVGLCNHRNTAYLSTFIYRI